MINERNFTLDHPSEKPLSAVNGSFETKSSKQTNPDITEGGCQATIELSIYTSF